jgi:uncharacterized protein (TIGR02246 family)
MVAILGAGFNTAHIRTTQLRKHQKCAIMSFVYIESTSVSGYCSDVLQCVDDKKGTCMSDSEPDQVTLAYLERFLESWNSHDLDGILQLLTEDCLYITGEGARLRGQAEIRTGLSAFLTKYPDAHWSDATHFLAGDKGASEWILTATGPDGERIELDSCDLFSFRDGKISVVSAYRRARRE